MASSLPSKKAWVSERKLRIEVSKEQGDVGPLTIVWCSKPYVFLKGIEEIFKPHQTHPIFFHPPQPSPKIIRPLGPRAYSILPDLSHQKEKLLAWFLYPPGNFLYRILGAVHIFYSTGLALRPL